MISGDARRDHATNAHASSTARHFHAPSCNCTPGSVHGLRDHEMWIPADWMSGRIPIGLLAYTPHYHAAITFQKRLIIFTFTLSKKRLFP
jgi:hypothetical protein